MENHLIFGGTPLGLGFRSPISRHFSRVSKQNKNRKEEEEKQRKEKHTSFGERFFTHRKAAEALRSLHPLCEILREDAAAFLQFLVLIPVALLHTHEPAFILGPTEHG